MVKKKMWAFGQLNTKPLGKNHSYLSTQSWSTPSTAILYHFHRLLKIVKKNFPREEFFFDVHSLDAFMFGFSVIFSSFSNPSRQHKFPVFR